MARWFITLTLNDGVMRSSTVVNDIDNLTGMVDQVTRGTNFMTFGETSTSATIYPTRSVKSVKVEKLSDEEEP